MSDKKFCISLADVKAARERIKEEVIVTPLTFPSNLSHECGCNLSFKIEAFQKCKSFKFRGAYNKISTLPKGSTVVAVSGGNHSQGVALACTLCDCKSIVYVPEFAAASKVNATIHYGSEVVKKGSTFCESFDEMKKALKEHPDWIYVPSADDPYIIAGCGTIALEILEQNPSVETIVAPIGGGGLISGVAYTIKKQKPTVRVIGVQMASCPVVYKQFCAHKNRAIDPLPPATKTPLADGLAVETVGELNMDIINEFVDDIVIVSEDDVAQAVALIAERGKIITEGAGAASFAAVLSKKFEFRPDENVCCIISGGNIELKMLSRCIDRALFLRHSRMQIDVVLPYGASNYSALMDLLVENHIEVISTVSLPHVDTYANKEHYSLTIDVPNPKAFEGVQSGCEQKGWTLKVAQSNKQ
ncbi:threonine ammonia-lyase [Histomonas meleagridis]|uniref:threonine ammonia-lyase n=1 Tax=Histomonas meleagridis TaxID=135588 RepID=UPI003559B108|nr:threonine ammonia-lyase [Histomonas meleagridis]KAH0796903.1 threonine ammonia-lyase [Histomonas meleagridis]